MNIFKKGSFYTGKYRNLFQENGMSERRSDVGSGDQAD